MSVILNLKIPVYLQSKVCNLQDLSMEIREFLNNIKNNKWKSVKADNIATHFNKAFLKAWNYNLIRLIIISPLIWWKNNSKSFKTKILITTKMTPKKNSNRKKKESSISMILKCKMKKNKRNIISMRIPALWMKVFKTKIWNKIKS